MIHAAETDQFAINVSPLESHSRDMVERACYAEIEVCAHGEILTRLEDTIARTVRDSMRGCTHTMGLWFASNWWRLRWEPMPEDWRTDLDWQMAHSLAAAGGGYVWPPICFAGDGEFVHLFDASHAGQGDWEPARYLARPDADVSASAFEAVIDSFVEGVLARLGDFGLKESGLSSLWAEVREERHGSKEVQRLRKLEAMAGYDPDAAPDALAADLRSAPDMLGEGAVGEIAASARHDLVKVLKPIRALVKGKRAGADSGGFPARLPALEVGKARGNRNDEPWLQAYRAARFARRHWGLGSGPISDKQLASLIDAPPDVFSRSQRTALSLPMAVRAGDGTAQIYLDGTYPTTKRFAVGRLLGDQLLAGYDEPLIPATKAKTVRQRLQRAFSQELLCPVDAIKDRLWNKGKRASDDEIQRVADEFGVSPRLVSTTLVNNRVLDRDALDYTY